MLPNLPPATEQERLSDAAKDLAKNLADVGLAMKDMREKDAPGLVDMLKRLAIEADKSGPALQKLFASDPKAARSLRRQFQDIIDGAAQMVGAVKEKVAEAEQAAAKANQAKSDATARGVARTISRLPSVGGGIEGAAVGAVNMGANALAAIGPEGEVAAAAIKAVVAQIKEAVDALGAFIHSSVQAANPGVWDRYERSLEDLSAVFGQAFSPAVEEARDFTDKLNGILSELAPIVGEVVTEFVGGLKPVIESLLGLVEQLASGFKVAWQEFGPEIVKVMRAVHASMVLVVEGAKLLIGVLAALQRNKNLDLAAAFKEAREQQAMFNAEAKAAGGKKTFAARPAEFTGIEEIGKKVQLAAASAGAGPGSQTKTTEEAVNALVDKVGGVLDKIGDVLTTMDVIVNVLQHPVNTVAAGVSDAAANSAKAIDNATGTSAASSLLNGLVSGFASFRGR